MKRAALLRGVNIGWQERIIKLLPFLIIFEAAYLLTARLSGILTSDLSVIFGFIPFVHILYSLIYLPSTIVILSYFSISEMVNLRGPLQILLSSIVALFTSPVVLSIWGLLAAYLLKKRKKVIWYLLIIAAIITIYDIYTALYIYSYIHFFISLVSAAAVVFLRKYYR